MAKKPPPPGNGEANGDDTDDRLGRDLLKAAATMSAAEVRFLVDYYYISQEDRKRAHNQVRSMADEPHEIIAWLARQALRIEKQLIKPLQIFAENHPVGKWMLSIHGIGPVIAAGMLAHIDIEKAPTAGHIWRFAGLDPTLKWGKGQKRPFNGELKTLCWKVGQSFMKFSGSEKCVYGHVYRARKEFEIARNERLENATRAAEILQEKKFGKDTEAYKHLITGKLPPAQIDARARRYAVKLFLSHLQTVWWFSDNGTLPPAPYAIDILGHAHLISVPNPEEMPGLMEALYPRKPPAKRPPARPHR